MPLPINIKAQVTLTGPTNVKPIVNTLQSALNRVKGTVGLKIDPKIAANLGGLGKKLDQFNASLKTTVTSANSANAALKGLSDTFRGLNNATKVVSTVQKTQQALQKSSRSTKEAADQLERFGELSALAVRRFAAFTIATGVIFGFARAVINATSEAIEFDRQLVRISQVRGTTVRNLDSLVNTITKLSTSLGVSSTELVGVAQTLAQAGLSARDTEKALEALAETSLAPTFTDISDTTEAAISVMAQFKLEAEDLKDVFGSINKVAADFAVEADDLTTVIRKAGGVFANAGSQLEEPKQQLNELLALFTSVRATTRQSADSIATGFNTIFARLQRPSTIEFLKNFNIELTDTKGKFVGAYEAVRLLNEGLKQFKTGDIQLAQITEELGGIRQLRNILPLIREFPTATKAFQSAQEGVGSTTRDAIKAQAALAVQFQKVKEEFLALIRSIADSQTFRLLATQVLNLASSLIKLADSVKPILPILTALAGFQLLRGAKSFVPGFINDVAGKRVLGRASGGIVGGSGSGDRQPAMLEAGEFIIPKNIVKKLGIGFFENLRNARGFQAGGLVGGPGSTQNVLQPDITKLLSPTLVGLFNGLQLTMKDLSNAIRQAVLKAPTFGLSPPEGNRGFITSKLPILTRFANDKKIAKDVQVEDELSKLVAIAKKNERGFNIGRLRRPIERDANFANAIQEVLGVGFTDRGPNNANVGAIGGGVGPDLKEVIRRSRAKNSILGGIGGFFEGRGAGQLNPQQLQNRAIAGSLLATGGLFLAGRIGEGGGPTRQAASTGITSGIFAGGLAGSVAGGPVGALVGVTTGIVSALDTFLTETNRIAKEASQVSFDNALKGLSELNKGGKGNINDILAQAQSSTFRQLGLRGDPNRSLNAFLGSGQVSSIFGKTLQKQLEVIGTDQGLTGQIGAAIDSLFGVDLQSRVQAISDQDAEFARAQNEALIKPLTSFIDKQLRAGATPEGLNKSLTAQSQAQIESVFGKQGLDVFFDRAEIINAENALDSARLTLRRFADELDLSTAKLNATNTVLQQQIDEQGNLFSILSGASLGEGIKAANVIGDILDNINGFTSKQVGGAIGTLQGKGLISEENAKLAGNLRLVQTKVPDILKNLNVIQDPEKIRNDFSTAVKELLPELGDPLREALIRSFDEALNPGGHEDFDAKKAVRDFNIGTALGDLDKSIGNALKAASNNLLQSTQIQINAIQQSIKAQEQYQAALLNSIEVEANAREKIAEVLGTDVNAAREAGLNARKNAFGVQGPAGLGNRIFGLEQRGAALRGAISTAQTPEEAAKFGKELQTVNDELIKAKEALELFSKDMILATIAADKLAKAENKRGIGREIAGGLLGGNRLGFLRQISALEKFQGGDLRTLVTSFESVQAGIELQARFLRSTGREQEARGVERQFEEGLGKILGPEFAKFITQAGKEEDQARELQKQAAELQIKAAQETLIAQKALFDFFTKNQGKAGGGFVRGAGTGTSDSIPARLSNGEFVFRSAAVNSIGPDALNFMNETGQIPGFANGGVVPRNQRIARRLARDQRFNDRFDKAAQTALARRVRLGRGNSFGADVNRAVIRGDIDIGGIEPGKPGNEFDVFKFKQAGRGRNFTFFHSNKFNPFNLTRQARRRAIPIGNRFRRHFADGGLVTGGSGISLDTGAIASLNTFSIAANNLAQAMSQLSNIPSSIQLVGNHTLNVNVNGAQVLANIMPALQEYVLTQIGDAVAKYNQKLTTG